MLTPIDIQNHSLKTAVRGYSKKETDDFLEQVLSSYEELYKENHELKDKLTSLSEGIQYYKQMETTLQKALVLAEKTSTETQQAAKSRADAMLNEANTKAEAIEKEANSDADSLRKETQAYAEITKAKANRELEQARNHVRKLVQSYENYRLQFKKLAESQIEMLESENFAIFAPELSEMLDDAPDADEAMGEDVADSLTDVKAADFEEPDMEENNNTIDSIASQNEESPVSDTEEVISQDSKAEKSNDSWVNTTPRIDGLEHAEVTNTVSPEQKEDEDSPFTFIDPE